MTPRTLPSAEYLRECFSYDPETGELWWRERPLHHFADDWHRKTCNVRFSGKLVGHFDAKGKRQTTRLNGVAFLVHRVIWKLQTGQEPPPELDHRNRKGFDNCWKNLREATHSENQQNKTVRRNSLSGIKGVTKVGNKFRSILNRQHLGYFYTKDAAYQAYCEAARCLYGEFWCG